MNSLNTKLLLSALGIALLATPAFAQNRHRQASHQPQYQGLMNQVPAGNLVGTYPNPTAGRTGSGWSRESGAAFGVDRGY